MPISTYESGCSCDSSDDGPFRVATHTKNAVPMLRALRRAKAYVEEQKPIIAKAEAKKRAAEAKRKAAAAKKKYVPKVGDKVRVTIKSGDCYKGKPEQEYLESRTYKIKEVIANLDGTFWGYFGEVSPTCFANVELKKVK